jgi:hypothetical protein
VVTAPNYLPYEQQVDVEPGPAGGIALDKEVYACQSEIKITVADSNLSGTATVSLVVTGGDVETIDLPEIGRGVFAGSIYSAEGSPNPGDGVFQVADGVPFNAQYYDADDGPGGSGWNSDQAVFDCQAPIFEGLSSIKLHGCYAHLTWEPAIDPHGLVTYNIYRYFPGDSPGYWLIGSTWLPGFVTQLCSTPPPYQFLVRAQDAPGNEEENNSVQSFEVYFKHLPIVLR